MLSTRERLPGPEIFEPGPAKTTPPARNTAIGSPRSCGTNGSPTASCSAIATTIRRSCGRTARRPRPIFRIPTPRPPAPARARRMSISKTAARRLDLFGRGFALLRLGPDAPTARAHRASGRRARRAAGQHRALRASGARRLRAPPRAGAARRPRRLARRCRARRRRRARSTWCADSPIPIRQQQGRST